MMNRQKSSRLQLGTYVVAVPVIAVLLWVFTLGNATGQEDVGDGPGRHADTTARDSTWIKPRKVNPREALYIIDGEERDYSAVEEIDPTNIESITVWKDKSAIEKYGKKGAKGVIEVRAKKRD